MEAKLEPRAKHPEFDADFRQRLQALLAWRRDVRRFRRDPLPPGTIERLIGIACLSPSVGLSEPWRFVIIDDQRRRAAIRASFESCNQDALKRQEPDRASLYARLKLSGLDDAPCQIAVFADRATAQGHGLGRLTMPETLDYSVAIAIHTLWLAARAEGVGVGWVSILDPAGIARYWRYPRTGPSSGIFASAIRRRSTILRPSSGPTGNAGILRRARSFIARGRSEA
jgi:5,6-dimethylbenzimidazole synthase